MAIYGYNWIYNIWRFCAILGMVYCILLLGLPWFTNVYHMDVQNFIRYPKQAGPTASAHTVLGQTAPKSAPKPRFLATKKYSK